MYVLEDRFTALPLVALPIGNNTYQKSLALTKVKGSNFVVARLGVCIFYQSNKMLRDYLPLKQKILLTITKRIVASTWNPGTLPET